MVKKEITGSSLVQDFLCNVAGDYSVGVVQYYHKKARPMTDEELAKHAKIKVTEIRTILNRLHYRGIAEYRRTRNKRTGWYSYTWTIKTKRLAGLILEQQQEEIERLVNKINFESGYDFFNCKNNCDNIPFEVAAEYQFKCPKCGKTMQATNNEKRLKALKERISSIAKEVELIKQYV